MTHSAHTAQQPGLMTHSWNPETDLLKQFRVDRSLGEYKGFLAVASYSTSFGAVFDIETREEEDELTIGYMRFYRVFDQFNNVEVWSSKA